MRIENLNVRADAVHSASDPGTASDDHVTGTAAIDNLMAGAGNDTVSGGAGADLIDLGTGADTSCATAWPTWPATSISGFGITDMLEIDDAFIGRTNLSVVKTADGATLSAGGSSFQLVGDFAAGDFMAVARGTGIDAHTTVHLRTLSADPVGRRAGQSGPDQRHRQRGIPHAATAMSSSP